VAESYHLCVGFDGVVKRAHDGVSFVVELVELDGHLVVGLEVLGHDALQVGVEEVLIDLQRFH
jgi:hypothetical protein